MADIVASSSTGRPRNLTGTLAWTIVLVAFAVIFCWQLITNHLALLHPDFYTYYYSFRVWFFSALASGHFPLWNPDWGLGQPAEVWATIPLDLFTPLELIFGPQYPVFQALEAAAIILSAFIVLVWLGLPRPIAAACSVLFFVSPWTNYFFFYFVLGGSFVAYVLLFYFLYRWTESERWKYLFFIGWTTFFSMLGTKLELWFDQTATFALLAVVTPWLTGVRSPSVAARRSAWAILAMMLGIAAQAWQLDILLPLMADSTRDLGHHLSDLFGATLWYNLAASLYESAFLQLAIIGLLAVGAARTRQRSSLLWAVAALIALGLFLALPTPFGGATRDGGLRHLILHFVRSPVLLGALAAAAVSAILCRDRSWRHYVEASVAYLVFVYYYSRTGHGDLGEVAVLSLTAPAFRFAMGFLVWLGCRALRVNPICRVALASIVIVFLMRDQGQVLLAALVGWQWIPTRDGYIVEFGFAVLAACGAASLVPRDAGTRGPRTHLLGSAAALAAVVATLIALRGDLYQRHPCRTDGKQTGPCQLLLVGKPPAGAPFFSGIPPLQQLLGQLRTAPTDRFYFANDDFMEFHHFMGTSLVSDVEQVTIYASLTSRRYREWTIYLNTGIRPEAAWRAYSNDLSSGTMAHLPPVNALGHSNSDVYAATLISRPPPRRDVLDLLGVKTALRLYPGLDRYVIDDGATPPRDATIDSLSPIRVRAISPDAPTPKPMFVADLAPLPRAFLVAPPSAAALGDLEETLEARAENGSVVTPSFALPVTAAHIASYEATHVVIDADTPRDSVLVLSDLYHPFWTASVDGQPAQIFPMFHIMRGVALAAGHHRIEFTCRVPGLRVAVAFSALLLVLSLAFYMIVAQKQRAHPQQ